MLTILVFEINKRKNAQKVKKNINHNLSLLIRGIIPRKFLNFETRKCYFRHSEHPKNKKLLAIIYHYLVVEKRNNLIDYTDIEGTRLSSEISHTRTVLTA
jgi:hypothetical protein